MWPRTPPAWLVPWLEWHLAKRKTPRPNVPGKIPSWAWEVARWVEWRISGGVPTERPNVPRAIEDWAWKVLAEVRPPVIPKPVLTFPGKEILSAQTLYVTWGLDNGQYGVESLLRKGLDAGYKSFALQATGTNLGFFPSLQYAVSRVEGVYVGLWDWATTPEDAIRKIDRVKTPDFFDANIEHLGDWPSYFATLRKEFPFLPLATSTNFWGFITNENAETFDGAAKYAVALGVACRPEAYLADNVNATPERLEYTAQRLGWPHEMIYPLVSLYAGPNGRYKVEDYYLKPYVGWGAYSAEYLL